MQHFAHLLNLIVTLGALRVAHAWDLSRSDNIVTYWGQNSYGATHESDTGNYQKRLSTYCADDTINAFPLAFLDQAFSTGGAPHIDLSSGCNSQDNSVLKGTNLLDCSSMADDIKACQAKGKAITLSLGGATAGQMFSSDAQARTFADTVWNTFLGGSGKLRPFGDAVLDGVDLDIEGGANTGYAAFVKQLRTHFAGAGKQYFVTAAPQCPYPDEFMGAALNEAEFDAVYVQFYNNYCGLNAYNDKNAWNFGTWDNWAKKTSPNKDVKVYIGALGAPSAGGAGYVDAGTLAKIAKETQAKYSSFGGVMFWDASQVWMNGRIDKTVKAALAGGSAPAPTAPASSSSPTSATSTKTRMTTSRAPTGTASPTDTSTDTATDTDSNTDYNGPATSASATSSAAPTPTVRVVVPGGSGSACGGAAAWAADKVYNAGDKVSHSGRVYAAKWWTTGEVPGTTGQWGVWADAGACAAKRDAGADAAKAAPAATTTRNPRLGIAPVKTATRGTATPAPPAIQRRGHRARFAKSRH